MTIPQLQIILFLILQLIYSSPHAEAYIPRSLSRGIRIDSPRTSLSESRRPIQSEYNNESGRGEEMYWEKYSGGNKEERELKEMSYPQETDEDDAETRIARYGDDDEEYFDSYDDEYPDDYFDDSLDEVNDPGNFWSNPTGGMDRPVQSRRSPRQRRSRGYAAEGRRRPPVRRSPVRMNQNSVPNAAKDFYERLFWYGFDAGETEGVGDKTVFGGTKGKFNGLSFKEASETSPYKSPNRRAPRRRYNSDYEEESNIDVYNEANYDENQGTSRSMKPPTDAPYPRSDLLGERRRRAARRQESYEFNDRFDTENPGDWVSNSVSSWFMGDGEDDDDEDFDDRSRRRRRRKQSSEWSPFNIVDAFFGVDRDEMQYKADLYNQKMGLGKKRRPSPRDGSRKRPNRETPRRPGYAYKYEEEDGEDFNPIVDVGMVTPEEDNNKVADVQNSEAALSSRPTRKRKEKSWEERSLAVERVPPAGVPAWGPSGEMPCDARTKAIMDALEDIETARQKVAKREKKEALATEEITILKVDAELQRRKIRNSGSDPLLAQEQLRQIEFEMDDASREVRRARTSTELAREQLERFEERHWALLRFYDPDKAEQQVEAALIELGEGEPAARMPDSVVSIDTLDDNNNDISASLS